MITIMLSSVTFIELKYLELDLNPGYFWELSV